MLVMVLCARGIADSGAAEPETNIANLSDNTVLNSYIAPAKPRLALEKTRIVVEADGSITPKKERIVDLLAAFESSVGAAVNMQLVFAKNSVVLTAEGQETLGLIADAIRYQDVDINVDLEFSPHESKGKQFTQRRASEIVRLLKSRYGVRNPLRVFVTSHAAQKSFHSIKTAQKGTDVQRLTLLNMGRKS